MTSITEDSILVDSNGLKYSNNFFIEFVKRRILDSNKNFLGIVCGQTGSGKTYSAIRIAELIDPNFEIRNIVFTPSEFMALINSGTLKRGACIIFEEAGTSIDRRSWYSVSNKMINYVLQTFRHLNLSVIFTTPSLTYIDSNSVKLFHTYIETLSVDERNEVSVVRPKMIKTDHATGKTFMKYLRVIMNREGVTSTHIMDRLLLKKADSKLLKEYELKKTEFTTALNKRVAMEVMQVEDKAGIDGKGPHAKIDEVKVLSEQEKEVYELYKEGYSLVQISQALNIRPERAKYIKNKIRKKGIKLVQDG